MMMKKFETIIYFVHFFLSTILELELLGEMISLWRIFRFSDSSHIEKEREAFNNQFTFLSILMLAAACLHCMHILHIFSIKTLNWNAGIFHQSTAAASDSFATIII